MIAALKQDAAALLAPQLAALVNATAQIILQPIFELESPRIAFGRVALVGDAAFVARPHVATGVMKAAIDAESLADALAGSGGDVAAALERYNDERQPYGAALVARGRHIGAYFAARGGDRQQRIETLMREYGAAGLVHDQAIRARLPHLPQSRGIVAAPMSRLPITIATWDYDRVRPLVDGRVRVEGCDVNFLTMPVEECFERAYFHGEFEVAEIGFSPYLIALSRGVPPYVAVPAFLSRMFRHSAVYIRTDRGIAGPGRSQGQARRRAGISDVGGDVVSRLSPGRVWDRREGHELGSGRAGKSRPPGEISAQPAAGFSAHAPRPKANRCRRCWPTARSTW